MTRLAYSLSLFLLVAACQAPPPAPSYACPAGTETWQRLEMVFGRNISGGGRVSDADWEAYVEEVLSPAFPDGLSVVEAQGRWLSPSGERFNEDNFFVLIYVPAEVSPAQQVDAAIADYKSRFRQETVLFGAHPVCLAFK